MNPNHFALVLLELVLVIGLSLFGRTAAKSLNQPTVLGELLIGLVFANIVHIAGGSFTGVVHDLSIFGELGVILLLFTVGLETDIQDMIHVGPRALKVASVGVVAPLVLGVLTGVLLIPTAAFSTQLFIGAALCATSVGITARVFKDLKRLGSSEAQLVLGAAVIDDVLGLVILTIVSGIATQGDFMVVPVVKIILITAIFFGVLIWFGEQIIKAIIENIEFLEPPNRRLLIPLAICFFLSWLASQIGLAAIVGAFAAGLILKDKYFSQKAPTIQEELAPLETLFAPVFFVLMGLQVDLTALLHGQALLLTITLCAAAVLGKMACALVAGDKVDGIIVGVGMLPRGEVGLIFAGVGKMLDVVDDDLFAAIVIMIIFTTLLTPAALKWAIAREDLPPPPGKEKKPA